MRVAPHGCDLLGHEFQELGKWVEVTPGCLAKEVGTLSPGNRGLGGL